MPEYPWIIYRMSEGPLTTKEVHQGVNEQLNRKLGTDWGYSEYEWANLLQGFRPLPIRTASGTIAHFSDGADSVPMKSVVANIVPIQEGSGTPSPSNPRPISGTSGLNVTRTGKNLFDKTNESEQINGYISASKIIADNNSLTVFTKCNPNTTYTVSKTAGKRFIVCWFDSVPNVGDTLSGQVIDQQASAITITTGTMASYIVAFVFNASVDTSITRAQMLDSIQIEEGSPATTYEPYTGSTYTIALGRTIYGGTADVVGGVGEETYGIVDLGSLTWTYHPASGQYSDSFDCYLPNDSIVGTASVAFDGYFEIYKSIPSANIALSDYDNGVMALAQGTRRFIVCDQRFTSAEALKTALNGKLLFYPLATPTDFTFTGQPINSLLGVNNVWTDSGEVLNVEYRSNF